MASGNRLILLSAQNLTGNFTSSAATLENKATDLICFVNATAVGAGTSLAVKIQHSPDGVCWFDLVTFTAIIGASFELKFPSTASCHQVRAVCAFTGGVTTATLTVGINSRYQD